MLAMFLGALDQTIVATALPTIGRRFGDLGRPVLGGHRLSADRHRGDAALRQIVRHPRPARADADRHRHLRHRLDRLRAGAGHERADRRPRRAGARRRRADGAGADHHRRHRFAARARPLPGLYRRGVRHLLGRRAGARRLSHRASRLVADLLDQSAARPRRARHDLERAAPRALSSAQAPARRHRRAADDGGGGGAAAGAAPGAGASSTGSRPPIRRAAARLGDPVGPVRLAAGEGGRAVPAAHRARQSGGALRRARRAPATWRRWSA